MSLGLVRGGGGTVGEAFHRGVLRPMAERDLDARAAAVIVGTSAGSIIAASIRRSQPATAVPALAARARRRLLPRRTAALTLLHRPRQALNALLLTPALASGKVSSDFLVGAVRRRDVDSWPAAALWIVAVRRADGRRVVFGRPGDPATDIASAVAASCAIPEYFTAMDVAGTDYVDGGMHSPTNADVLADLHLDLGGRTYRRGRGLRLPPGHLQADPPRRGSGLRHPPARGAGGRLLPGDQRSVLVQQVTTVRTGIPTDAVTEAPVDLILRGPCHGSARGPRTETAPALPERSPRGA